MCVSISRFLYGDQAKFFEAETKPRIKHKKKGTVSMANNGDNLHGSQVSNRARKKPKKASKETSFL